MKRVWWYECARGHRFGVVVKTEPKQYVVKCPVCGTTTVHDASLTGIAKDALRSPSRGRSDRSRAHG